VVKKQITGARIFLHSKEGQGIIEYALIISFIALVVILGLQAVAPKLIDVFSSVLNGV